MLIGCDLNSRKIALTSVSGSALLAKTYESKAKDRAQIVGDLYRFSINWFKPGDVVYIEAPVVAGARNIQSTIKCAAAYGAVLAAINTMQAVAIETPVSSWKLAIVGKGNVSKSDVADWLNATHPDHHRVCGTDQDLIDATCIALYGDLMERSAGGRRAVLHQASVEEHSRHWNHRD